MIGKNRTFKTILVTGAGGNASIGLVRCLRVGLPQSKIIGIDSDPYYVNLSIAKSTYLAPKAGDKDYIKIINRIISKEKVDFLYPQTDSEIFAITKDIKRIKCKTFLPNHHVVRVCSNKYSLYKLLSKSNIPCPETLMIKSEQDLKIAIRKRLYWLRNFKGAGGKGAFLAKNYEDGLWWINFNNGWNNFSASRYLPGDNFGCDLLFNNGKLIFSQVKKRLEYVLSKASIVGITGTTAILETVSNRRDINELSIKSTLALDKKATGAFSVDIKSDQKGNSYVTEINAGRFLSSSLHLFHRAKFLAPVYLVRMAFEDNLPNVEQYNPVDGKQILIRQIDREPVLVKSESLERIRDFESKEGYCKLTQ